MDYKYVFADFIRSTNSFFFPNEEKRKIYIGFTKIRRVKKVVMPLKASRGIRGVMVGVFSSTTRPTKTIKK